MRILAFAMLISGMIAGCATTGEYGNYLEPQTSEAYSQQLAQETAAQMGRVWAPARTELALAHPATDAFGIALLDALRSAGFAVREYEARIRNANSPQAGTPAEGEVSGSEFRYVVDQLDKDLVRVSVSVGQEGISRAYSTEGGGVTPAGTWAARKG